MAEPDPLLRTRLAECFLPAYNRLHATSFANPPEPERAGDPADLRWPAPRRGAQALEVQLIRGASSAERERIHPGNVALVQTAVQQWCDQHAPTGYAVSLTFSERLLSKSNAEAIANFATGLLAVGLARPPQPGHTTTLHDPPRGDSRPRVRVHRLSGATTSLVFATPESQSFLPQTIPRLRGAIDRKQNDWLYGRQSDLVLLVDFDVDGYDGGDLQELRVEAAAGVVLFREIWGVSLWYPGERSDRLWP